MATLAQDLFCKLVHFMILVVVSYVCSVYVVPFYFTNLVSLKAQIDCQTPLKIINVTSPTILTVEDLSLANSGLISLIQRRAYLAEFAYLLKGKPVKKRE